MAIGDQAGVLAVEKLNNETLPQLKKDMVEMLDSALTRIEAMVTRVEVLAARMEGATLTGTVGFQLGPPAPPASVDPGAPK